MPSTPPSSPRNLVVVFVAGTNEPSNSNVLADHFIEGMKEIPGLTFEKIRVKELSLQHFTLEHYKDSTSAEPDYNRIKTLVQDAAGVVVFSPVWNFSVPAHLKNLIDRIGAFGLDQATHSKGQLKGKPFGILYTGGAPMIGWKALIYLTTLHVAEAIKYYNGTVVLRHFEPRCMVGKGKFGLVVDKRPASLELMKKYGKRFGGISKHYAESGSLPLINKLWQKWFEFLYRVGNRLMYPISAMQ